MDKNNLVLLIVFFILLGITPVYGVLLPDLNSIEDKIREFTSDKDIIIVQGTEMSKPERVALNLIKDQYPEVSEYGIYTEEEFNKLNDSFMEDKVVFLIGGPHQSNISKVLLSNNINNQIVYENMSFGKLSFVELPSGERSIVFSDPAGFHKKERFLEKSPLANFMPIEYIPATATMFGLILLWLWSFSLEILHKIVRSFVSSKLMKRIKKKMIRKEFIGFTLFGIKFKVREWIAIFISSIVFAVAFSFSYVQTILTGYMYLIIKSFVNMIINGFKNIARMIMDKKHNYHSEYIFWWWGGIITIISGWFGNAIGLAGYTVSENNKEEKDEANIEYFINIVTFAMSLISIVINFFFPNRILDMIIVLSLAGCFLQMLPMVPFSGKNIFKYHKLKWFLFFIPLSIVYIMVNIVV